MIRRNDALLTYLLVHSPLLGPSSWARVGALLDDVVIPDLSQAGTASEPWRVFVDLAVEAVDQAQDVVVVGHSGAGAFLPLIGAALKGRLNRLVFVDAVVPPDSGKYVSSEEMLAFLDGKAVGGVLPRWNDWWSEDVLVEELPKIEDRDLLASDAPRLPRSFYDHAVPVPPGWIDMPCSYVRLSEAYDHFEERAVAKGWMVRHVETTHVALLTEPRAVANAVRELSGSDI